MAIWSIYYFLNELQKFVSFRVFSHPSKLLDLLALIFSLYSFIILILVGSLVLSPFSHFVSSLFSDQANYNFIILKIFSKNQLLVSLMFSIVFCHAFHGDYEYFL